MTNIIRVPSITRINFSVLQEHGVEHIFADVESTLCPYGKPQLDRKARDHIAAHRERGTIKTLSLITNNTNVEFGESILDQLDGVELYAPRSSGERKPRPDLFERAAQFVGARPEQVAMIGDKLSADMAAAKAFGASYGFWVHRLGQEDHPGDRWIRRPYEAARGITVPRVRSIDSFASE